MSFTIHRNRMTHGLDLPNLTGIEIGPLVNPIVSRDKSNVKYVDRASTEDLKEWYSRDPGINVDDIMQIDYIWGEQSLAEATGGTEQFDYCVASHVIEHIPDLITWLGEIASILKVGGVACFAVPDRRYTFDYLRSTTTAADVVDNYLQKLRKPSFRHIYDHFSKFTELHVADAWSEGFDGRHLKPTKTPQEVYNVCIDAQQNDKYIDSHCSVFTEDSFFELINTVSELGLLDFKISKHFSVEPYMFEFYVHLEKLDPALSATDKHLAFKSSLDALKGAYLELDFNCSKSCTPKIYFDTGNGFNETEAVSVNYQSPNEVQKLQFNLPLNKGMRIRFDPAEFSDTFNLDNINLQLGGDKYNVNPSSLTALHGISKIETSSSGAIVKAKKFTKDPALEIIYS